MVDWSSEPCIEPWFEGKMRLVISSWAAKTPMAVRPDLPVSLVPQSGSATVRVKTAWSGVRKKSPPSRKKGRFSG